MLLNIQHVVDIRIHVNIVIMYFLETQRFKLVLIKTKMNQRSKGVFSSVVEHTRLSDGSGGNEYDYVRRFLPTSPRRKRICQGT